MRDLVSTQHKRVDRNKKKFFFNRFLFRYGKKKHFDPAAVKGEEKII